MEVAVGSHLEADVRAIDCAQKMMPLENLMQQDPVEEAAEREPKQVA
jgi:hypothetical protein